MKPTLSYVRGLRDVLGIHNKKGRRKHIARIEIRKEFEGSVQVLSKVGLPATGISLAILGPFFYFTGNATLVETAQILGLAAIPLIGTYAGFKYLANHNLEAKLHETSIAQEEHIHYQRSSDDFPQTKLALDNF